MKCYNCDFYKEGYMYNACSLTGMEYFHTLENCTLVNDDGTINEQELKEQFDGEETIGNPFEEEKTIENPFEESEVEE